MINFSQQHREEALSILSDYSESKFVETRKMLAPILASYHALDPNKIEKRLLQKLFGAWKNKNKEAMVHYWTLRP